MGGCRGRERDGRDGESDRMGWIKWGGKGLRRGGIGWKRGESFARPLLRSFYHLCITATTFSDRQLI